MSRIGAFGRAFYLAPVDGDEMTDSGEWASVVAVRAELTAASGYDYEESRLSPEEYDAAAEAWPAQARRYERGIITGGAFDCWVAHQLTPVEYGELV